MGFVTGLSCRNCASVYPAEASIVLRSVFRSARGGLRLRARFASSVTKEAIAAGPPNLWRYAGLLPVDDPAPISLGAGYTPLIRAERLGAELGFGELWIKDDTRNPTGSFKDRVVVGRADESARARLQGRGVRVDRQPRELGGRPRRLRRDGVATSSSRPTSSRRR